MMRVFPAAPKLTRQGLTMIELLVVVAILGILALLFFGNFKTYQGRARDARRKSDLDRIKVAFEDYYNDHNCYPPADVLLECKGDQLEPYLNQVPCDPFYNTPYAYVPFSGNSCKGYRLLANLEDKTDPIISEAGCDAACGCGFGADYVYGVSAGLPLKQEACTPYSGPGASPSPSGGGGSSPYPSTTPAPSGAYTPYACSPGTNDRSGVCNIYQNTVIAGCPISFAESNCQNACSNPAFWCTQ